MSATRAVILDTTERLMVEEGYAAVSTRSVAAKAGLKPALVHYYFVTTEDLFVAAYRRAADRYFERLTAALESERPVSEMWEMSMNPTRTTLAVEFMALANHRKPIRTEISRSVTRIREAHAKFVASLPRSPVYDPNICPPIVLSFLVAALTRTLVMEDGLGISSGHAETKAFVQWWIERFEGGKRTRATQKRPTALKRNSRAARR